MATNEQEPTGDRDVRVGLFAGSEVTELVTQCRDRVVTIEAHRVRIDALRAQRVELRQSTGALGNRLFGHGY